VNGDERGMSHARGFACLANEPRAELLVDGESLVQDLERDVALQNAMMRGVHGGDSTAAEERADLVLALDRLARPVFRAVLDAPGVGALAHFAAGHGPAILRPVLLHCASCAPSKIVLPHS
jgi:hypothetical protein